MLITTFLGAGSAFAESTLGQLYKEEHEGEYRGGPAYYIEKGLGNTTFSKIYGIVFAIVTVLAVGMLLPGVQSNSIAVSVNNAFGLSFNITAVILVIILALIIFGGIKRIGSAAELIVPFMGGAYILMAIIIILVNIGDLPAVLALIFKSAFGCVKSAGLAWTMGDIGVGLMAWLNLVAIMLLSNIVVKCFKNYEKQMKLGIPRDDITFDPTPLGIKGAEFLGKRVSEGQNDF